MKTTTIILTKPLRRQIEWVMRAAPDDAIRLELSGVHIYNGWMEASDGFRVHRWKWEMGWGGKKSLNALKEISGLANGLYEFIISEGPEGEILLNASLTTETKYPDMDKVTTIRDDDTIPTKGSGKPARAHAYVNNYFLQDAMNLRGVDGYPAITHLTITGQLMQIDFINGTEGGGTSKAIVKLLHTDDGIAYIETTESDNKRAGSLFGE